ncbi:MAG: bifunctional phosphoglucose/phosphomannose isomerase [Candidatus Marinimicrobia bacterium]|nr:bifunctional phosphoglucose/phosphomannose isomerase [Candidatus Neomarinimicrobiota bacterium]MBL7023428.1 bifunctional phosphoglucose/phosphomannose isomerase [Candidatus Neomarinimicrobiota bacterium]MBL7108823.1 bifunctional phosphoglucose/phosphomannose isomerase [Candidatus Neomarinimicrobiota bacterium]
MEIDIRNLKSLFDSSSMHDAICSFPQQIQQSFDIMKDYEPINSYPDIRNVLILGMGGSAIGGDVVRVLMQDFCKIPILVNRSYDIPGWVNESTLVIASSYSGGTEETLSAFHQCLSAKAKIIVISTGGEITKLAENHNLDIVKIPAGFQPRAALGLSFSTLLLVLNKLRIANSDLVQDLKNSIEQLDAYSKNFVVDSVENEAIMIAKKIFKTIPVIYGSEDLTWVAAYRFRCQLEENAKMMAFHHHIPEQNHNEIEGWNQNPELLKKFTIIWLSDEDDHERSLKRMKVTKQLLNKTVENQITISETGNNRIVRLLKMIHFTDWISYYSALLHNVDPTPVERIQLLKRKMNE